MTDLERLYHRLVQQLAAADPARLHRPLPLDEIVHSLVPYRANRRALGVDTSEEYELMLMRLCAGEGGLVRTEPEEARARFAEELGSANPDLAALHSFESVLVTLRPEPLAMALGSADAELGSEAAALPEPPALPEIPGLEALAELDDQVEPDPDPETIPEPGSETRCAYCGGRLPTGRPVNFCPHCGQNQTMLLCPECRSEIEPGWKHCVKCGHAVSEA
ncbi:MAG TPA: zinc ribbon domain-containing protein [Gemmatimonadales bacterium]|nr:zinc ribbon domain-containing protein [Gemmatimonadales bacterium]